MFKTLSISPIAGVATWMHKTVVPRLRNFRQQDCGGVTVEYVLWLPFLVAFTLFVVDTSVTLHQHARMWDTARYTARLVSTGDATEAAAIRYAESTLSQSFDIAIDTSSDEDLVVVSIVGVGGLGISSPLDLLGDPELSAIYVMRNES